WRDKAVQAARLPASFVAQTTDGKRRIIFCRAVWKQTLRSLRFLRIPGTLKQLFIFNRTDS
ncbi:MAG: hypothetical protein PHQ75_02500, partial [Thermoguttaceae bacterium]|nr:hypothetical protein [Thermoguttaceae bacterium]